MGWACSDLRPWAGHARTSLARVCSTRRRFAAPDSRRCAGAVWLPAAGRVALAGARMAGVAGTRSCRDVRARPCMGFRWSTGLVAPQATRGNAKETKETEMGPVRHGLVAPNTPRAGRAPGNARSKRGAVHAAVERVSARPAGANVRWAGRICSRWRGGRSGRTARACASASACTRAPPTPASSASSAPDTVSPGHTHGSGPPGHTRLRRVDG